MSAAPKITREVTRDGEHVRYVHSFCSSCSYWHAFTWTVEDAYGAAERHLINVHDVEARVASRPRAAAEHRKTSAEKLHRQPTP